MKSNTSLIFITLIVFIALSGSTRQPSDGRSSDGNTEEKSNYRIVAFDRLSANAQKAVKNNFFIPSIESYRMLHSGRKISVEDAKKFTTVYRNFINKTVLVKVPGSADVLAEIQLRDIIHNNICVGCRGEREVSESFPSYNIDAKLLKDLINSRSGNQIKFVNFYPAIREEGGDRFYTLVMVGLDSKHNVVLNEGLGTEKPNNILEYIEPCRPKCRTIE